MKIQFEIVISQQIRNVVLKKIAKDKEKTLIRKIVSYFDKQTFNVIYREYKFVYSHWLVDLDMDVVVHMSYVKGKHVPTNILYKGFWDALLFKPERADFKLVNTEYKVK